MAQKEGKNRSDYKRVNRGLVMKMVATGRCASRVELVQSTGLSKMAISNIVNELIAMDLLCENDVPSTGMPGRKPKSLMVSPSAPRVVGVLISRVGCEAVICSLDMKVQKTEKILYDAQMNRERLIEVVYRLLDTILYGEETPLAIGISSPGPINVLQGRILNPNFFFGIQDVRIVEAVEKRYHLPVFFDHDNQGAARAEALFGNGRGSHDIFLIGVNQGVGCGIYSSDRLQVNGQGLAPEVGHVSIDYNGKPCVCGGKGCLECYVSTPQLLQRLYEDTGKFYTYEVFCGMTEDPAVDVVFQDAARKMSVAIVSVINILNSSLVLLSDDFVHWDDKYVRLLEDLIETYRFTKWSEHIPVRKTYFENAALIGSACNAADPVFEGTLLFR